MFHLDFQRVSVVLVSIFPDVVPLCNRISEKTVSFSGGILFLLFALHGLWQVNNDAAVVSTDLEDDNGESIRQIL